jgi:release factor glutamine methyltransferase
MNSQLIQTIQTIREALTPCYPEGEVQAMTDLLLEKRLGVTRMDRFLRKDIQFSAEQLHDLADILTRLQHFEPIQYVLGEADFDGLCFAVNEAVLIPRQETAELVRWVEEHVRQKAYSSHPVRILDIGTGSGCIAIALAHRLPEAAVEAWDVSEEALAVARENNRRLGTTVDFRRQDVFEEPTPLPQVEVLVSNPPYICDSERTEMEANVLEWEPALALFVPDADPLRYYRRIAQLGRQMLTPGGALFFEINRAYGAATVQMLEELGYQHVELRKDLSGNDRMVKAVYEGNK